MSQQHDLEALVCRLAELGRGRDSVTVGDMQDEIGHRSFGPCLFVPAILELSPVGGLPGVPTVLGVIVVFFAAQLLLGHDRFWLPGVLVRRQIPGQRLNSGMKKIRPVARAIDKVLRPRLPAVMTPVWLKVAAVLCVALCLAVPALELVPFASSVPFTAIALFGLALIARDGLAMVLAFAVACAAAALGVGALVRP